MKEMESKCFSTPLGRSDTERDVENCMISTVHYRASICSNLIKDTSRGFSVKKLLFSCDYIVYCRLIYMQSDSTYLLIIIFCLYMFFCLTILTFACVCL